MQLLDFNEESCVTAASGIRTLYYCGVSLRLFVFDGCMFCFINSFNSAFNHNELNAFNHLP